MTEWVTHFIQVDNGFLTQHLMFLSNSYLFHPTRIHLDNSLSNSSCTQCSHLPKYLHKDSQTLNKTLPQLHNSLRKHLFNNKTPLAVYRTLPSISVPQDLPLQWASLIRPVSAQQVLRSTLSGKDQLDQTELDQMLLSLHRLQALNEPPLTALEALQWAT